MAKLSAHTISRTIEPGTVVYVGHDHSKVMSTPAVADDVCIIVNSENFPGVVSVASEFALELILQGGPTVVMEPVPAGHPAHGEISIPGTPLTVWKITKIL